MAKDKKNDKTTETKEDVIIDSPPRFYPGDEEYESAKKSGKKD